MTITNWIGNGQNIAQLDTVTVTAVAVAGTLTATINGKAIVYTCVTGDTTTTAASNWLALLSAATVPPEFAEITWANPSAGVVTATASTPGTPFTMAATGAGSSTLTQVHTTANSSQSDVGNGANWLRGGSPGLPQDTDDVVVDNSSVPLLWNLTALAAIKFNSFTRRQSFTGTIGLPENNPNGYYEYRPTYFQFTGSGGGTAMQVLLGQGAGGGPGRERYDVQTQKTTVTVLASGGAQDAFAIRILGTNAANVLAVQGSSVGVAMITGEVSTIASATVDGGGTLGLGPGVTFSGALNVNQGICTTYVAPATCVVNNGAQLAQRGTGLTFASLIARQSSRVTWLAGGTITALTLGTGTIFDKSQDLTALTITNSTIDGDSCQILDPINTITFTNATVVNNNTSTGPFVFGPGRTLKLT